MTIAQILARATSLLQQAGVASPRVDAEWLLLHVLKASRVALMDSARVLSASELEIFEALLQRRVAREPLQWILGSADFYGLELSVRPGVLIPRPETERLVELALERLPKQGRVIDVGCGSGAIALTLKFERPELEVWASDINPEAILLTLKNAKRLNLQIQVVQTSLLENVPGTFDAIISNPPYLPSADSLEPEVQLEPKEALFSGSDGLELARVLARQAANRLEPNGFMALELDPRNAPVLARELQNAGWAAQLEADLTGRRRFVIATRR
jgi:release factor glutamine methyltransferase